MRKRLLFVVLFLSSRYVSAQYATDTFHVYFDLNVPELNASAKSSIDSLIYFDRIVPGQKILIVGYADYLGTEKANQKLSEERAKNVRGYLSSFQIDLNSITLCIGRGQVNRKHKDASGYPTDRRVDIVVEKGYLGANKKNTPLATKPATKKPEQQNTPLKNDVTDITQYKQGESYVLKNIYFLPERHAITAQSLPELEKLFHVLKSHPTLTIRIEGHVCCIRDYPDALDIDAHDMNLSVNRAKAIYDYLVEKGISASRLKYTGYGRSKPVVINEVTEEDANKNRRVEIRVLSQ